MIIKRNRTKAGNMKTENNQKDKPNHVITLDKVLKILKISGYKFAKDVLKAHANALTPIRKPGYDPKLSTLLFWCKLCNQIAKELKIDYVFGIEDFFESPDYKPKGKKE